MVTVQCHNYMQEVDLQALYCYLCLTAVFPHDRRQPVLPRDLLLDLLWKRPYGD